jgi:aerobic-type carbon monoxide dehydrogenase small subunit (CoxS/CutS family)
MAFYETRALIKIGQAGCYLNGRVRVLCKFAITLMSLFSLSFLSMNAKPSKQEIEDNFDGHLCRCTGMAT